MRIVYIFLVCVFFLSSCLDQDQLTIDTSQALTKEQRSCDTSRAEGYLQGAVIKADPDSDFVPFGEDDHACGIPFVDIYKYAGGGVYTDTLKTYCKNNVGPEKCQLPQEMTNCFYQLQAELFNLTIVVPSLGYDTKEAWTWAGSNAQYVIKSQTLKEALDTAMGYVGEVCQKEQGDVIDKIVSQLRSMPVSLEVRDTFHAAERVKEAQRKAKVDPFHLVRGYEGNCFRALGYLLPPNVLYNHFPLSRVPKIDLETASQPYTCESSQYTDCSVLSVAKAETGHIATHPYTYRFSQGILALRQTKGTELFEKVNINPYDIDHPYPLVDPLKVSKIEIGVNEVYGCYPRESVPGGMTFPKKNNPDSRINPLRITTVDLPAKHPAAYFSLHGRANVSGGYMDADNPCSYTKAIQ